MDNKTIAIIPARGGSKRIPRKNIRDFCGRPVIAYAIEAALAAGCFDTVMVSTDDGEIAALAKEYGASVPFMRSSRTADDFAATADVLHEVLAEYRRMGEAFDRFCCIYPTCPLLAPWRLATAMAMLDDCDGVMAVTMFSHPPQRGLVVEDGLLKRIYPQYYAARSQDLAPQYHDSGQFYACRTEVFMATSTLDLPRMKPIVLTAMETQDIDSEEDWQMAEMKYMRKQ